MADRWRRLYERISYSDKLDRVSDRAALLYTWMIAHTDDWGRMQAETSYIRKKVIPGRKWSENQIQKALEQLDKEELIIVGYNDKHPGKLYLEIVNALEFQVPGHGKKRKVPEVPEITEKVSLGVSECKRSADQTRPDHTQTRHRPDTDQTREKDDQEKKEVEVVDSLSKKDQRWLASIKGCNHYLQLFLLKIHEEQKGGLSESRAQSILKKLKEMYETDKAAFEYALNETLEKEDFDWTHDPINFVIDVFNGALQKGLSYKEIEKNTKAMKVASEVFFYRHKLLKHRRADGTWNSGLAKSITVEAWSYPKECECLIKAFRGWSKWGDSIGGKGDPALKAGLLQRAKELFRE